MPHVKGNKFKVTPAAPAPASEPAPESPPAEDSGPAVGQRRRHKARRETVPVVNLPTVVLTAPKGKTNSAAAATPNWAALKAALHSRRPADGRGKKRKAGVLQGGGAGAQPSSSAHAHPATDPSAQPTRVLAVDCEMVGAGEDGERSLLARVCVVNAAGCVLYDSFVQPTDRVTDYRTRWSGVRAADLRNAPPFEVVQAAVAALLRGRVLVGHAVDNDLQALVLTHPARDTRDTSRYPPLMKTLVNGRAKPQALRHLAREHLGLLIQEREHSPVEDAKAALSLYQKHKGEWEKWVARGGAKVAAESAAKMPSRQHGRGKAYAAQSLAEMARDDYMADL